MKCVGILAKCRDCGFWNKDEKKQCPNCGSTNMKCTSNAVKGYNRCEKHGGPNPKNNYYGSQKMVTGMNSQFPITRLAAKYAQIQSDGVVMSNRAAIDVIDTRIRQLLDRVDVEDAPERMARLYTLWQEYEECLAKDDKLNEIVTRKAISETFEKAYHDYQGWKQILEALDLRGKQVEREVKVIKEMKGLMTAEDGYELVAKIMGAIMRLFQGDSHTLKKVQYEFTKIIGEPSDLVIEEDDRDIGRDSDTDRGEEGFGDVDQEELLHPRNQK